MAPSWSLGLAASNVSVRLLVAGHRLQAAHVTKYHVLAHDQVERMSTKDTLTSERAVKTPTDMLSLLKPETRPLKGDQREAWPEAGIPHELAFNSQDMISCAEIRPIKAWVSPVYQSLGTDHRM